MSVEKEKSIEIVTMNTLMEIYKSNAFKGNHSYRIQHDVSYGDAFKAAVNAIKNQRPDKLIASSIENAIRKHVDRYTQPSVEKFPRNIEVSFWITPLDQLLTTENYRILKECAKDHDLHDHLAKKVFEPIIEEYKDEGIQISIITPKMLESDCFSGTLIRLKVDFSSALANSNE